MIVTTSRRFGILTSALAVASASLVLSACGGGGSSAGTASSPAASAGADTAGEAEQSLFDLLPPEIQESGVLSNAADFTYPPLEYAEADGKTFTGVDYDLAVAVAERLGVELENANAAFGTLIPMLQSGRADMVFSFATVTDERKEVVDFIEYSQSGTAIMVLKGNPDGIKSLADLCGKSVGLQSGAVQVPIAEAASQQCVADGKEPNENQQMGKDSEVQNLLRAGRIAADLLDSPVAAYSAEQTGEFEVVPGERYEVRPHGVMVLKGNAQLAEAIKAALDSLVADGTYQEILAKYNVPDIAVDEITISRAAE